MRAAGRGHDRRRSRRSQGRGCAARTTSTGRRRPGLDGFCSGLADALHGSGVRAAGRAAGLRHRADDRGHGARAVAPARAAAGGRGDRARTAPGPRRRVWCPWHGRAHSRSVLRLLPRLGLAKDAAMIGIVVVGIGADGMAGLGAGRRGRTARAQQSCYGSPRQLDLLDETVTAQRRQWPSPMLRRAARRSGRHRRRRARGGQRRPDAARRRRHADPGCSARTR